LETATGVKITHINIKKKTVINKSSICLNLLGNYRRYISFD
jgi:hypothetical protein